MRDSAVRYPAEQTPNMFGGVPTEGYDYIWHWTEKARPALGDRKGERCRVLVRSRTTKGKNMNSVLVQFSSDGLKVNTSRYAVRKAPAERVRRLFGEHPNAQSGIDKPDSPAPVGDVRLFGNSVATSDPFTALYVLFGVGPDPFRREEGEDP
jgi:hypothetical protein